MASNFPAWQTDDLAEEWIEEESEEQEPVGGERNGSMRMKDLDEEYNISMSSHGTRDLSFTEPLASYIRRAGTWEADGLPDAPGSAATSRANSPVPVGTFLVREDMPAMPMQAMLPKTPGRNKKGIVKDIFSPTPLERMFDPPSPPSAAPSSSSPPPSAPKPDVHTPAMPRVVMGGMASLPRSTVPAVPSRLAQTFVPPSESSMNSSHARSAEGDSSGVQELTRELTQSWNAPLTEEPLPSGASSSTPSTAMGTMKTAAVTLAPPDQKFTFSVPRMMPQPSMPFVPPSPMPQFNLNRFSQAQSTPSPSVRTGAGAVGPPLTDPRLRLFQFNYDTYTREHLSAMVDSIAVNTPTVSGDGWSPSTHHGTPKLAMHSSSEASFADLRSTKRVKLSSASDLVSEFDEEEDEDMGAVGGEDTRQGDSVAGGDGYTQQFGRQTAFTPKESKGSSQRPKVTVKERVGDARSLFDQIRQAPDFSTVSSAVSGQSMRRSTNDDDTSPLSSTSIAPPTFNPPHSAPASNSSTMTGSKRSTYLSLNRKQEAVDLMAQIKQGSKRLLSVATTNVSAGTYLNQKAVVGLSQSLNDFSFDDHPDVVDEMLSRSDLPLPSPQATSPIRRPGIFPHEDTDEDEHLIAEMSNMSVEPPWSTHVTYSPFSIHLGPSPITASAPTLVPSQHTSSAATTMPTPTPTVPVPMTTPMPAYPSTTARGRTDDLNRFVSSSTASGATVTSGGASFVKHAGPALMTRIAPEDVPTLPDRYDVPGRHERMVLDRINMRWYKVIEDVAQAAGHLAGIGAGGRGDTGSDMSEDPFRDIESLRGDDTTTQVLEDGQTQDVEKQGEEEDGVEEIVEEPQEVPEEPALPAEVVYEQAEGANAEGGAMSVIEEVDEHSEPEDDEEMELNSFSFEGATGNIVQVMTGERAAPPPPPPPPQETAGDVSNGSVGYDDYDDGEDESEDEDEEDDTARPRPVQFVVDTMNVLNLNISVESAQESPNHESAVVVSQTPMRPMTACQVLPPRSALRSGSATPVSAMKDPLASGTLKGHRRSVSFSDGRTDGPIRDLIPEQPSRVEPSPSNGPYLPSARSKRIADMMDQLVDEPESPSKLFNASRFAADLHPSSSSGGHGRRHAVTSSPLRNISRRSAKSSAQHRSSPARNNRGGNANTTLLTDASFGVARDRIVEVLTLLHPYEPHWEDLTSVDLSDKAIDSVARLKEFLPNLNALYMNRNHLSWLSGIPASVRTLSIAANSITSVTSFGHLLNLESLDISCNNIDSLRQLACLRHLRELKADGNKISSIDGLQRMTALIKLSLQGNNLRGELDVRQFKWSRLQMLNVSSNGLTSIVDLASLSSLIALNADNNSLTALEMEEAMPRMRILRVSNNRLRQLDCSRLPNARTIYVDNNALSGLLNVDRAARLENLSLRNQSGRGFKFTSGHVRDVKRLYLSGNALEKDFIQEPCYNLIYLEVAACRLTTLQTDLARLVPNLRVLNLNYNFIEDTRPLEGLSRLRKLTLIGSRVKGAKSFVRLAQRISGAEVLDFRMNPCTLGWYLPLLVQDVPGALQPSSDVPGATTTARTGHHHHHHHHQPHGSGNAVSAPMSSSSTSSSSSSAATPTPPVNDNAIVWMDMDAKFRRDLPDEAYVGRLAYRGLIMRACAGVRVIDGVNVSEKERAKAEKVLKGIMEKKERKEREKEKGKRGQYANTVTVSSTSGAKHNRR